MDEHRCNRERSGQHLERGLLLYSEEHDRKRDGKGESANVKKKVGDSNHFFVDPDVLIDFQFLGRAHISDPNH